MKNGERFYSEGMEEGESKVDGAGSESYKMEDSDGSCVEHFGLAAIELDG